MWCLGRYLLLLFGDLVDDSVDNWEHYLLLLSIMDHLVSHSATSDSFAYLKYMIEEYLGTWATLYPDRTITPKMHCMIHLPTWMAKFGPLVHFWCMRYEAKHSHFKRMAGIIGNFTNLPYTLAKRHQLQMCYRMVNCSTYLSQQTSYGKATVVSMEEMAPVLQQQLLKYCSRASLETKLARVKTIDYRGCKYREGDIVITGKHEATPVFGKIDDILHYCKEEVCFFSVLEVTSEFCPHYHAYNICITPHKFITTADNLLDTHPLNTHCSLDTSMSQNTLVTLKFNVL